MSQWRGNPACLALGAAARAIVLLCAFAAASASAAPDTLATIKQRDGINIAPDQISISGVSAGGWQAVQYHVAHSKQIMGVGVVAGGPYHCAGSWSLTCIGAFFLHDACQATLVCSRFAEKSNPYLKFYLGPPDVRYSIDSARDEARRGAIDPLAGLKSARVWIFTGGRETDTPHDTLMPHDVVKGLVSFYSEMVDKPGENIAFVENIPAEHAMPVANDRPGEAGVCGHFGPPFINNCDYAAAEQLLSFIYKDRQPVAAQPASETSSTEDRLQTFTQAIDANDPLISMNKVGHIYVPRACMHGRPCPLHVALHGCSQDEQSIDEAFRRDKKKTADLPRQEPPYFYRRAGYNAWAERYGVVILYPQARTVPLTLANYGCWDWFGYSGPDYHVKSGKQIRAINAMVECLAGTAACQ